MVVEKLITRAKKAVARETDGKSKEVHARRETFSFLHDHKAVSSLFNDIAPKVATRPGGYTRVVKLGQRQGDGAELATLELVDYNLAQETTAQKQSGKSAKPRRKRGETKGRKEEASPKTSAASEQPEPAPETAGVKVEKPAEEKKAKKEDK